MKDKNKTINFIRGLSSEDIISYYRMRNDASELIDVPNVIPDGVVIPEKGIYGAFRDGDVHDKEMIFCSKEPIPDQAFLQDHLQKLEETIQSDEHEKTMQILKILVPEYSIPTHP